VRDEQGRGSNGRWRRHVTEARGPATPATAENLLLRLAVEHFLFEEAAHLDNWRLDDWLALFTEDGRYVVPTTDLPNGDPKQDVVFIDDDCRRLRGRVDRLKSRFAHREYPWSRTRRLITNIRLTRIEPHEIDVEASFAVYRARAEAIAPYIGIYRYTLSRQGGDTFRIRHRRAELDLERLSDHGAVSIIL
jgi:p-cumate 2,3-dioxygenase beta subunit